MARVSAPAAPPPKLAPSVNPAPPSAANSRSAAEHNKRGRELIQQHKYSEAIEELTAALRDQRDFALALNARGFAYVLMQDWPRALEDLDAALGIDPSYANAYANRAVARRGAGDIVGAQADQAKARELTAKAQELAAKK